MIIEEQGDPWGGGELRGPVRDRHLQTERPAQPPQSISECSVEWGTEEAALYEGLLLDNLREEPQKTEVDVYADGTAEDIERGTPFVVSKTWPCGGEMIHLSGEAVDDAPSVEGRAGPAVENQNGSGDTGPATGTPGFGALVGLGGVAGGALLHALRGRSGGND